MTDRGPVGEKIAGSGFPVRALAMRKGLPDPRGILRLYRSIHAFRPDIIQTWMYHANLLGLLFIPGRTLIWNIRCSDMDLSRYGLIYRISVQAGAFLAGVPDAVIANAQAGRTAHEAIGYHPRRWEIIPNGFDTALFKPDPAARAEIRNELQIPHDAIAIGLIARLDPMKDHQTFFSAIRLLLKTHPDVHIVLAGRGVVQSNPIIQHQDPPRSDHLHLLGERNDIPRILAALDISSSSSSYGEGFPTIIGESMSVGLPCVVTDTGDARLLVDDGGIIVPRRQPEALANAFAQLINAGPEKRADLGEKARTRILTRYSLSATVEAYQTLYRELKKDYSL